MLCLTTYRNEVTRTSLLKQKRSCARFSTHFLAWRMIRSPWTWILKSTWNWTERQTQKCYFYVDFDVQLLVFFYQMRERCLLKSSEGESDCFLFKTVFFVNDFDILSTFHFLRIREFGYWRKTICCVRAGVCMALKSPTSLERITHREIINTKCRSNHFFFFLFIRLDFTYSSCTIYFGINASSDKYICIHTYVSE